MGAGRNRAARCLTLLAVVGAVFLGVSDMTAQTHLRVTDFPFAWYLRWVQIAVAQKWEGHTREGSQPQVVFEIDRDGNIRGLAIEKSSGDPPYDQAALRAINQAAPFPPLPEDFKGAFLRVEIGFWISN